jgi:hypothetical protein
MEGEGNKRAKRAQCQGREQHEWKESKEQEREKRWQRTSDESEIVYKKRSENNKKETNKNNK